MVTRFKCHRRLSLCVRLFFGFFPVHMFIFFFLSSFKFRKHSKNYSPPSLTLPREPV